MVHKTHPEARIHPGRPDVPRGHVVISAKGTNTVQRTGRTMSDFQAIADRVEIEALRSDSIDAQMMDDYDRYALLFTPDGVWRVPAARSSLTATPPPAAPTS